MADDYPSIPPVCECGEEGCELPCLPLAAWTVAGSYGAGRGIAGTDLLACAPGHVPECAGVIEDNGSWIVCGATS